MRATAVLKEKGISVQHMHVSTLKPFTDPTIVEAIKKSKYGVVTIKTIWISAVSAPLLLMLSRRTDWASVWSRSACRAIRTVHPKCT